MQARLTISKTMATSSMSPASTGGGSTGQASAHKRPANLHDVGFAHGVIMLIAFGILFPLGGCLLRALHGRNVARIHAYWQSTAWALAIIGFGMGVYIAKEGGQVKHNPFQHNITAAFPGITMRVGHERAASAY
jgi:hypothetical protein